MASESALPADDAVGEEGAFIISSSSCGANAAEDSVLHALFFSLFKCCVYVRADIFLTHQFFKSVLNQHSMHIVIDT